MEEKPHQFESGHPDLKPAPSVGFLKKELAHFGALEDSDHVFFRSEKLKKIYQEMQKSITLKNFGGDINARWYVEYRELDTHNLIWKRVREYGGINREKDAGKRMVLLQELFIAINANVSKKFSLENQGSVNINFHIGAYLADKANSLRKTSIKNMKGTLNLFYQFLCTAGLNKLPISHVTKDHIRDFRIHISKKLSNRSVNNHMDFLKAFFNYYVKNYENLVQKNPCIGISKLPNTSETHVAYSDSQTDAIFNYLKETDKSMWLYCQFVGLGFVRCEEVRNLKVGNINFQNKTLTLTGSNAKTRRRTVKPLLNIFFQMLLDEGINKHGVDEYIFSYGGRPGKKQVHYNHFQKKFKKIKTTFNLSDKHTIYGFRHTFVCKMLHNGAKWHEIMKYTGHTTMEAFSKYARSILVQPAEDLSGYI